MKTKKLSVHKLLLALAVALPLCAATGASANESGDDHPAMMHGGPDRDGPDSGPRMHGGMPPFGGPGMGGPPPFMRGVELSEAQEDKVFAILHEEKPYLREQGKAAAKAHEALREMAGADKYDDAKAASLAQAAATAMANIALQRVRTEQKLLAVLTPEQRKKQAQDKDGKDKPRRPRP
ncbi:MAG TPA: periplasmic heavy metal sensor [Duganella sp.]|nr:periplasmic heavy metal sensor [Duganella sp.]